MCSKLDDNENVNSQINVIIAGAFRY